MTLPAAAATLTQLPQGLRFLLAGGFAAAVNWAVRFPLSLILPYVLAVLAATAIGMAVGFAVYRHFVFPTSGRAPSRQLRDFIAVNVCAMAVVAAVAVLFKDGLFPLIGLALAPEAVAHAIGIAAGALVNFIGHRHVTFGAA